MGVCTCPVFCCTLRYVHSSIAIILKGKRGLVALLITPADSVYLTFLDILTGHEVIKLFSCSTQMRFSLALSICELWALFFVSS